MCAPAFLCERGKGKVEEGEEEKRRREGDLGMKGSLRPPPYLCAQKK